MLYREFGSATRQQSEERMALQRVFLLFQNAQQTFLFPVAQRYALHFFGETCEDNTFQTKPEATN
jgi:hypothetical protein